MNGVSKINMCLLGTRTLKASTHILANIFDFLVCQISEVGGANQIVVSIRLLVPLNQGSPGCGLKRNHTNPSPHKVAEEGNISYFR